MWQRQGHCSLSLHCRTGGSVCCAGDSSEVTFSEQTGSPGTCSLERHWISKEVGFIHAAVIFLSLNHPFYCTIWFASWELRDLRFWLVDNSSSYMNLACGLFCWCGLAHSGRYFPPQLPCSLNRLAAQPYGPVKMAALSAIMQISILCSLSGRLITHAVE